MLEILFLTKNILNFFGGIEFPNAILRFKNWF